MPQTTSSTERPAAGATGEKRSRPASAITAWPQTSDAPAISAPARRAESIRGRLWKR